MTKPREKSHIHSSLTTQDPPFDASLRPKTFDDFIGQPHLKERLSVFVEAAKQRKEPLGHCLFHGPPGLGKTTLATILSQAMGTHLVSLSAPAIQKAGDLAGVLTSLEEGDLLFIDEIHRLGKTIEEYLYSAMEDFSLDLLIDSGPASRSVQVSLKPFTLVGATTRSGMISGPMRSRFGFTCRLDYYPPETLALIIERSAKMLNFSLSQEATLEIASRARGTPRVANHLVRWVRDFAQINHHAIANSEVAHRALELLAIDKRGLDELDKKFLTTLIDHHNGGPAGINTLAAALCEDPVTLSEVYEPYLILQGFLRRTPRGREATDLAYAHLQKSRK